MFGSCMVVRNSQCLESIAGEVDSSARIAVEHSDIPVSSRLEFKRKLELRTKEFAVSVFKLLDALPTKNSTKVIAYQLGKSASSVGANYREANRSESGDDFRHKTSIVLKEADESLYWLEVLGELYPTHDVIRTLAAECEELLRLFQRITRTSRERARMKKPT